jgi:hypothetical protein
MLPFLDIAERDNWHHLLTGDESWFFSNALARRMWTLSRDNAVAEPRLDIQGKNSCLRSCVIWVASILSTYSQMMSKGKRHGDKMCACKSSLSQWIGVPLVAQAQLMGRISQTKTRQSQMLIPVNFFSIS